MLQKPLPSLNRGQLVIDRVDLFFEKFEKRVFDCIENYFKANIYYF